MLTQGRFCPACGLWLPAERAGLLCDLCRARAEPEAFLRESGALDWGEANRRWCAGFHRQTWPPPDPVATFAVDQFLAALAWGDTPEAVP